VEEGKEVEHTFFPWKGSSTIYHTGVILGVDKMEGRWYNIYVHKYRLGISLAHLCPPVPIQDVGRVSRNGGTCFLKAQQIRG